MVLISGRLAAERITGVDASRKRGKTVMLRAGYSRITTASYGQTSGKTDPLPGRSDA
jgi:hypothetical protein